MKSDELQQVGNIDVNDDSCLVPIEKVYPGYGASETVQTMLPDEKESFLKQCRDWLKEAVNQILTCIDIADPVLVSLTDVNQEKQ